LHHLLLENTTQKNRKNMRKLLALLAVTVGIVTTGCSTTAPQYTAAMNNVQALKDVGNFTTKVGGFTSVPQAGNANPISVRGSSVNSPYNASYANYLEEALKQELALANKLSASAADEISGSLLKNDIDATGFSVGMTTIEARFIVKRNGTVSYDAVKSVKHEFPSSFMGAVAIPRAIQEYTNAVQKILGLLYEDPAFKKALNSQ
jgi:hypothetical protein